MAPKKFSGKYSNLAKISKFIIKETSEIGFSESEIYELQLAVDEACTNIIEHSYGGEDLGNIIIEIKPIISGVRVLIEDKGTNFDPSQIPEIDRDIPLNKVERRGAGLFLMKKLMDSVKFDFGKKRGTILTMEKFIKN